MYRSIVEYCAEHGGYKCGYCKSPNTNYSHGLWAHSLSVSDYQDLVDRGWRRSGKYCYKPTMDVTCCPMYTIRCRALEFKISKSQKKVLKRFNKHLMGQDISGTPIDKVIRSMSTSNSLEALSDECVAEGKEEFIISPKVPKNINISELCPLTQSDMLVNNQDISEKPSSTKTETMLTGSKTKVCLKGSGPDPNKSPCKKAKQLRRERKIEKLKDKGIDVITLNNNSKNKEKQIEDILNELSHEFRDKLRVRLVRTNPPSTEWLATSKQTHELYVKYQTIIHNDRPEKCTESALRDFLVNSPLLEEYTVNGPPCGYGSFHQQYWLEEKLVAVGVIDILPKCVSSVYFFYDPQYMSLTLGTYGALREIAFTRHLNSICPGLKYYYMGFYIHTCRKMRYKGNFYPSYLLCPETYKWFPINDCIAKLEVSPYSRLDTDIDSVDENFPTVRDIKCIPIWNKGKVILYKDVRKSYQDIEEYSRLVGAKSCKSLVLVR